VIVPGAELHSVEGYCDNVAHGLLLAWTPNGLWRQIYNISDEKPIAVREWIEALSRILNHEFEFIEIPFDLLPQGFRNAPTQHSSGFIG